MGKKLKLTLASIVAIPTIFVAGMVTDHYTGFVAGIQDYHSINSMNNARYGPSNLEESPFSERIKPGRTLFHADFNVCFKKPTFLFAFCECILLIIILPSIHSFFPVVCESLFVFCPYCIYFALFVYPQ